MSTRRLIPTAVIAAAALGATATTADAAVPCFKNYATSAGTWKVQNDGALSGSLTNGGSAGDQGQGRLKVGGAAYPALPGNLCTQTDKAMAFPTRTLGGFSVTRSVNESGGKLRWLDTIKNPGVGQAVSVDFGLEVLPSQLIMESESGNDSADEDDHWTAHKSQGLFSTHQWGHKDAIAQPTVVPEDGGPRWEDDFGDMDDDATLRYSFFIGAGQTVRLLHAIDTAPTLADAVAKAKNAGGVFAGYSKAFAKDVVNFGDDPDGDGVNRFNDDCPSVKGAKANGCEADVAPPQPADPVDPDAPAPPADQPPAGNEGNAPQSAPTGPTPTAPAADTTGPVVTFGKLGKKVRRGHLTRKAGSKVSVSCSEECRISAKVEVKPRGRKKAAKTIQRFADQGLTTKPRELRLKVKAPKLRGLASQKITLVITATDRAGNTTTTRRVVGLR